jgi:hypothetical protein
MNTEMAELRKILDMFEGAGFTVTYLRANYFSCRFAIVIKSSSLTDIEDFKHETATASAIVRLIEGNSYQITNYGTGPNVVSEYGGTICLEIAAGKKE